MIDVVLNYDNKPVIFFNANPKDYIGGQLLEGKWWELSNLEFIRNLQVEGDYVDVGAYIGTHTLFFALFCKSDTVYAIEPQMDAFYSLFTNVLGNNIKNCKLINVGISNERGRGKCKGAETNAGGAWLLPGDDIDVVTLDSLHIKNPKLIKIDVEGAEYKILEGAKETLANTDHLLIEMWKKEVCKARNLEYNFDKVVDFLKQFNIHFKQELTEDLFYFHKAK